MTTTSAPTRVRGIDALGWLELVGSGVYLAAAFGVVSVPLVGRARNELAFSAATWWIAAAIGLLVAVAVVLGTVWPWRRRGGRRIVVLARRSPRTGELPDDLATRRALLRELERRDRALTNGIPGIVLGVLWTVLMALRIVTDHSVLNVIGAVQIWLVFVAMTMIDMADRRLQPRRRALIARLREEAMPSEVTQV